MDIEIKAPTFPESVADGNIITWHKKLGDSVAQDEILVDIETDKVMFEVPALVAGVLKEIVADVGATVLSQEVLAILDDADVSSKKESASQALDEKAAVKSLSTDASASAKMVAIAPAARNLIAQNGLDESLIPGTGKGGRILKEDVQKYISNQSIEVSAASSVKNNEVQVESKLIDDLAEVSRDKRVPMTRLRARVAERLVEVQKTAAILTTFNEVNMQPVMDLRQRYKDKFEKVHGVRLGFMSFFVKASIEALKRFPAVNASVDGGDIIYHNYFDIGIAVSSPRGLVVPILRNTEALSLAGIEAQINTYAIKAKEGSLTLEDISGGTFTITNGGVFGSMLSTPILNPPQSAILGMHKIEQRAVVEDGEIVARPVMYLALSYDHRIIDGQEAVQFLVTIKELLEDPARIMLEI